MVGNSQVIFEKAESSSLTLVGTFLISPYRYLIFPKKKPQDLDFEGLREGKYVTKSVFLGMIL